MPLKRPQIPEEHQNMGKLTAFLQLICFLIVFISIYVILRKAVQAWYLRILILLADYFVTAMFTYLVIRPLASKIENKIKKK